jgi:hypothetical protein
VKVREVERFEGLVERRCERFIVRVRGREVMVGEEQEQATGWAGDKKVRWTAAKYRGHQKTNK